MNTRSSTTSRKHQLARSQNQREGKQGSIATFTTYADLLSHLRERVESLATLTTNPITPEPVRKKTTEWLGDLARTLGQPEAVNDATELASRFIQSGPGPQLDKLDAAIEALAEADVYSIVHWTVRAHTALAATLDTIAQSSPGSSDHEWLDLVARKASAVAADVARIEKELDLE